MYMYIYIYIYIYNAPFNGEKRPVAHLRKHGCCVHIHTGNRSGEEVGRVLDLIDVQITQFWQLQLLQ